MAGHLLNITITANEALKDANITILDSTYVMSVNGTVANASVNVYQNSTEDEVLFNITAFDLAGNSLTVNQTHLNSSNLTIDQTNPTLSNLTIYSNNHNTSLATLGDILNITITANENLSSANITLLNATYAMSITGVVANASVIVNATHADGKVEFNITAFDLAGNSLTVNQTHLNSPNITIDENVPGVTNLTLYSNNSNSSLARAGDLINITLEASEQIYNATLQILNTTINMTESNNTAYANISVLQNSPNGPVAFNITAYDIAGNEFNVTQDDASANVIIDTTNPTLSNLTIYSNNHNTSLATMSVILIVYVASRSVIFALERSSFAVIVMFRVSPKVASEVLWLLLYMVRFESVGLVVSIMTFADASSCVTLNSLPAISYAVMLNATGPFGEFCRTEMFAYAVLFDSVMFIVVLRICKVAL